MENYFNYFTEIEEQFLRRRGGGLLLSTLDWALIETWKEAGIPLEAVLRGIDAAFNRYDERPSKSRKVNSLAYCAQEVLSSAEEMKEAAVGATNAGENSAGGKTSTPGLPLAEVIAFLRRNAEQLETAKLPESSAVAAQRIAKESAQALREIATGLENKSITRLEDIERRLTVMEEKLFSVTQTITCDEDIVTMRAEADRELAPYRRKMIAAQIEQLHKQYVHKKLFEKYGLPRLSLFYM